MHYNQVGWNGCIRLPSTIRFAFHRQTGQNIPLRPLLAVSRSKQLGRLHIGTRHKNSHRTSNNREIKCVFVRIRSHVGRHAYCRARVTSSYSRYSSQSVPSLLHRVSIASIQRRIVCPPFQPQRSSRGCGAWWRWRVFQCNVNKVERNGRMSAIMQFGHQICYSKSDLLFSPPN